jgi:hypothetical protein
LKEQLGIYVVKNIEFTTKSSTIKILPYVGKIKDRLLVTLTEYYLRLKMELIKDNEDEQLLRIP